MDGRKSLSVGVVVASLGRPDELGVLLDRLETQTRSPSAVVLSVTKDEDAPADAAARATIVKGAAGLPAQRNRGMTQILHQCDVVAFFDDDYIPSRYAIESLSNLFAEHPDVVGATGTLLADGIGIGGIALSDGLKQIDDFDRGYVPAPQQISSRRHGLYGCNMAYRSAAIGALRFDEALPLYAWQEDMDFAAQIMERGRIVQTTGLVGVHCGVTRARSPGVRLGYSQIANPAYLVSKGTMRPGYALQLMVRNALANHVKAIAPEPWVDRMGRAKGNWLALRDFLAGKLSPGRIMSLPK